MLDIGLPELVVILVIAVLVFGPERLPRMISQGAQWLRVIKAQATAARDDLMTAADLDPETAGELRRSMSELAELHPRRLANSLLSDVTGPLTSAVEAGKDVARAPVVPRGSISPAPVVTAPTPVAPQPVVVLPPSATAPVVPQPVVPQPVVPPPPATGRTARAYGDDIT